MLFLLLAFTATAAEPAAGTPPELLSQVEALSQEESTVSHWVALAEFHRTRGKPDAMWNALQKAGQAADAHSHAVALADLACWRSLPVGSKRE
ncbi:hypothetical protein ACTGY1_10320, partial [Streptococcus suis]